MKKEKKRPFQLFLLLVIMLLNISIGLAQKSEPPVAISWGKTIRGPLFSATLVNIIASNNEDLIRLQTREKILGSPEKLIIEKYDTKFNLKGKETITLRRNAKDLEYITTLNLKGNLYLFTSFKDKVNKKLFYQRLNEHLKPAEKYTEIIELEASSRRKQGFFDFRISEDKSKILIIGHQPSKKDELERFKLKVLDNKLNIVWDKDIILPYDDEEISIHNYKLDNQGNVYILGWVSKKNEAAKKYYSLLIYSPSKDEPIEYKIQSKDKFIKNLTFIPKNDGNLVFAGFYSKKGYSRIHGTCFFNADANTKRALDIHFEKFEFDFLTEDLSKRDKKKTQKAKKKGDKKHIIGLKQYALNSCTLQDDGGVVLIAEQYFSQKLRSSDPNKFPVTYYYYNNIIAVSIAPNGEIEWTTHIPKRQVTKLDRWHYSSYAHIAVEDKIYFIFNDSNRNTKGKVLNQPHQFLGRGGNLILAEIGEDGNLTTWSLFNNSKLGVMIRPKICKQSGSRKLIIYGENRLKFKFGELTF